MGIIIIPISYETELKKYFDPGPGNWALVVRTTVVVVVTTAAVCQP